MPDDQLKSDYDPISDFYGGKIIEITGNFGGSGVKGLSVGFTAISLGNNLFLAQITQGIYKKGITILTICE
jgi:hypothetical protein